MFQWMQLQFVDVMGPVYSVLRLKLPYMLDEWPIDNAKWHDICQCKWLNDIVNCTHIEIIRGMFSICFDEYGQIGLGWKSLILRMFAHIW